MIKIKKPIHLTAIGVPKLTLQRWLKSRESLPGGKKRYAEHRELIDRRTKSYSADELRLLLQLGEGDYVGFKGIDKAANHRLSAHVTKQRNHMVSAALKKIDKLSK